MYELTLSMPGSHRKVSNEQVKNQFVLPSLLGNSSIMTNVLMKTKGTRNEFSQPGFEKWSSMDKQEPGKL